MPLETEYNLLAIRMGDLLSDKDMNSYMLEMGALKKEVQLKEAQEEKKVNQYMKKLKIRETRRLKKKLSAELEQRSTIVLPNMETEESFARNKDNPELYPELVSENSKTDEKFEDFKKQESQFWYDKRNQRLNQTSGDQVRKDSGLSEEMRENSGAEDDGLIFVSKKKKKKRRKGKNRC